MQTIFEEGESTFEKSPLAQEPYIFQCRVGRGMPLKTTELTDGVRSSGLLPGIK